VRATFEVVGDDFGSPWWWRGRPSFHNGGDTSVATDVIGYTAVSIHWC
jgi:hypothetical protein